jgi:hypothetical protein
MVNSKSYGLQTETRQYLRRLYAYGRELNLSDVADIDNFIKGLKQLGLWSNTVCWLLRSQQNLGTGTIALSLGGLGNYNGTLVNTVTWGSNGVQSGGVSLTSRINISTDIRRVINYGTSIFGVVSNNNDDNYYIFQVADSNDGNPTYPSIAVNQASGLGVVPVVTRNSVRYFQATRGGAYLAGFSSVAGVLRTNSQANFRNGTVISNEINLGVINPDSQITVNAAFIAGRGNGAITGGGNTSPISLVSTVIFTNEQISNLHLLYKTTIGKGLGLP